MRTLSILGFLGWCSLVAACTASIQVTDDTPGGKPAGSGTAIAPPSPEELACTADADCVVVETACCDHCNGGAVAAFNKDHAEARKPKGCEGTMCTERGCGAAVAKCVDAKCTAEILPLGG
jgi:hypothetical protein